jgi:pimeloyl-ACP methyl ester carboxylesterase
MRHPHPFTLAGLSTEVHGAPDVRHPVVLLHGLSYDRRQWGPLLSELVVVDPGRLVLALDLPGHGGSVRRPSYHANEVARSVHQAVAEAGFGTPVMVGHGIGGLLATVYAATYPAAAVVNIDQPLLLGLLRDVLLRAEPTLRGPLFAEVWQMLLRTQGTDLLPPAARDLVSTATTPRQDLLLGYWDELLTSPAITLSQQRMHDVNALRDRGVVYHHVSGTPVALAYRNWLKFALPGVTFTVLPDSGHFPHLTHPAEMATIIAAL